MWTALGFVSVLAGFVWTAWVARKAALLTDASAQLSALQTHVNAVLQENAALRLELNSALQRLGALDNELSRLRTHESSLRGGANALIERFLTEAHENAVDSITDGNLARVQSRLSKLWAFVEKNGFTVTAVAREGSLRKMEEAHRVACEKAEAKKDQSRIKEEMREQAREEREHQQAVERDERSRNDAQKALEKALLEEKLRAKDGVIQEQDSAFQKKLAELRLALTEAETKAQRSMSLAQQTRAGHVYVISNVGAFGDDVYKIGMTRRADPQDRVDELGDASVPFPFDIHMMIGCSDAPMLENRLHTELADCRMNLVNVRKEYFQVPLDRIRSLVERLGGEVKYELKTSVMEAEAFEYNESERLRKQGRASEIPIAEAGDDE
jgi:regulator of replication initiation timing